MEDLARAERVIETALATAAAAGDEADAACIVLDRALSRFASSRIHQNLGERSLTLTVRVILDGRIGVATSSPNTDDEIRATTSAAADLARRSEVVPEFRGLYRSAEPARGSAWDEATARFSPMEKAEQLRDVFDAGRRRGITFAGSYSTSSAAVAVGNTHGVRQSAPYTAAEATLIALAEGSSGFATALSRRRSSIDLGALADEASGKATMLVRTEIDIPPGEYTVILEPPALAEIFEWMNSITFAGRAFEDGSSFFVGNIGKSLLDPSFTLADDAVDLDFLPFPFDLEGLPKRRVPLVEQGVIRGPVVDKVSSDRLGIPPTGSAAGLGSGDHGVALHLDMGGGEHDRESLIGSTERGIWITRFHYLNGLLDPKNALMTGMTRDGTFLIEDGKPTHRLPNLRWTQPMVAALASIDGLSRERRTVGTFWNSLGGTRAPTARIRGWRITGKSGV